MNAVGFAWRSLVRQPARASLGILGVASVGALLLDMLLLSQGLIVSMGSLLERTGWDLRVTGGGGELPIGTARIPRAAGTLTDLTALPSVRAAIALRFARSDVLRPDGQPMFASFEAVSEGSSMPWRVMRGRDPKTASEIVINDSLASALGAGPGAPLTLRGSCRGGHEALPPVRFTVTGIAEFPFEEPGEATAAGTLAALAAACGGNVEDEADLLLVMSAGNPDVTAAAIRTARPDLTTQTNQQVLGRLQEAGFTYFRQISTVLTTVTLSFAVLLITVLLTVSVNQRLAEIAALRALGFSRRRVVADVLSESALIVGIGGVLSLPLGLALARALDSILKRMPGIPEALHFFVFQPSAVGIHMALLTATAIAAALYPMFIVSRLPITATLRDEVAE
jgi:hypothetical protein